MSVDEYGHMWVKVVKNARRGHCILQSWSYR